MDSFNLSKGYMKLNHLENEPLFEKTRKPLLLGITVTILLLLTLIIGLVLGVAINRSESSSLSSGHAAESIRVVCGETPYPETCWNSISSLNFSSKLNPNTIFNLSLQACINELSDMSMFFRTMVRNSNEVRCRGAMNDCASQLEDALSRLHDSISAMEVGMGEKTLTEMEVSNIQTWISAAVTDEEACLDGLEEVGSMVVDEARAKMQPSRESMSNSLAIIAKMKTIMEKFDMCMH